MKREKVGTKQNAIDLLRKRKNDIRAGIKMPENMRQTSVRFKTLCDDILVYSKQHHRDFRSVEIRVRKIVAEFGEKSADKIKPAEIDAWLSKVTKTPATSNRYADYALSVCPNRAIRSTLLTSWREVSPCLRPLVLRHPLCGPVPAVRLEAI